MVSGGLFEEAAIILRPGLKGIRHTRTMLGSIKNLCTGVETGSASLCFKNRKKRAAWSVPSKPGAVWCEIRQVGPGLCRLWRTMGGQNRPRGGGESDV